MQLLRCPQMHFYDGDKFPDCPYCHPEYQNGGVPFATGQARGEDMAMPVAGERNRVPLPPQDIHDGEDATELLI